MAETTEIAKLRGEIEDLMGKIAGLAEISTSDDDYEAKKEQLGAYKVMLASKTQLLKDLTPTAKEPPTPEQTALTAAQAAHTQAQADAVPATTAATASNAAATTTNAATAAKNAETSAGQLSVAQANQRLAEKKAELDAIVKGDAKKLDWAKFEYQKVHDDLSAALTAQGQALTKRGQDITERGSRRDAANSYRKNAMDFVLKFAKDMPKGSSLGGNAFGELMNNADLMEKMGASAQAYADKTGGTFDDGMVAQVAHIGAKAAAVSPAAAAAGTPAAPAAALADPAGRDSYRPDMTFTAP